LGFPHGMSEKFGLWTFHELSKRQKNFDFTDFWLPYITFVAHFLRCELEKKQKLKNRPNQRKDWPALERSGLADLKRTMPHDSF